MNKLCKCGGMNEECLYCGGKGFIEEKTIEIIKTVVDSNKISKENSDLDSYLHSNPEKMYVNNKKSFPRQKKKTVVITLNEIKDEEPLKYIGPNNPNRGLLGDTRKFAKKGKKATKSKAKKKEKIAKMENNPESEFLFFWDNNIKRNTKDNLEFQECLSLFLKLNKEKREKFKIGIVKKKPSKHTDIRLVAQELFNKLTL